MRKNEGYATAVSGSNQRWNLYISLVSFVLLLLHIFLLAFLIFGCVFFSLSFSLVAIRYDMKTWTIDTLFVFLFDSGSDERSGGNRTKSNRRNLDSIPDVLAPPFLVGWRKPHPTSPDPHDVIRNLCYGTGKKGSDDFPDDNSNNPITNRFQRFRVGLGQGDNRVTTTARVNWYFKKSIEFDILRLKRIALFGIGITAPISSLCQ